MRTYFVAIMAASLIATSAIAAVTVSPLPSGKPAGVKTAQDLSGNTVWWVVGLGAVAAGIGLVASGNSDNVTTTTTTTTK